MNKKNPIYHLYFYQTAGNNRIGLNGVNITATATVGGKEKKIEFKYPNFN